MLTLILLIGAFLCFVLAAFGVSSPRVNLIALGLALWVLTALIVALVCVWAVLLFKCPLHDPRMERVPLPLRRLR